MTSDMYTTRTSEQHRLSVAVTVAQTPLAVVQDLIRASIAAHT